MPDTQPEARPDTEQLYEIVLKLVEATKVGDKELFEALREKEFLPEHRRVFPGYSPCHTIGHAYEALVNHCDYVLSDMCKRRCAKTETTPSFRMIDSDLADVNRHEGMSE